MYIKYCESVLGYQYGATSIHNVNLSFVIELGQWHGHTLLHYEHILHDGCKLTDT